MLDARSGARLINRINLRSNSHLFWNFIPRNVFESHRYFSNLQLAGKFSENSNHMDDRYLVVKSYLLFAIVDLW